MDVRENPKSEIRCHGARKVSGNRFSDAKFRGGFTLIELLVVIAIIAILMALLFPAFTVVQDQAKRTQAKNDIAQIVTAVNAFYTEYGQYPCDAQTGNDGADFFADDDNANNTLFDILRGDPTNGNVQTYNPKAIASFNRRSRRIWPIPGRALAETANSTIRGVAAIASGWTTIILVQLRIRIPGMRDSVRSGWE